VAAGSSCLRRKGDLGKGGDGGSQSGLRTYRSVVDPELWPGIDLVYTGTARPLKYTFLVKPGADPGQIKLAYSFGLRTPGMPPPYSSRSR
jgi:hypothetical protein